MTWTLNRDDGLSNTVVSHILDPVWEGSKNNRSTDSSEEGSNNNGGEIIYDRIEKWRLQVKSKESEDLED